MIEIFLDSQLQKKVNNTTLYENNTYFVKLTKHDSRAIEKEITSGKCAQFIDWHPKNLVGQITFRDVAGFTTLFGKTYDVRSTKLLTNLNGNNQIEYLLKEIAKYSSTLVFFPAAPASFYYDVNPKKLTSNIFYVYKYLSANLFHNKKNSLQYFFEIILDDPHFNQCATQGYVPISTTKKFNYLTFQKIAEWIENSHLIPPSHELFQKPFISKLPTTISGNKILPKSLYSIISNVSYDTLENRFLKYFLFWCQEIFLNIYSRYDQYEIREDCSKSLKIIRKYLFHPFFRNIGNFSFLPTTSSVFANRFGYKEIFLHYLKCRSEPKIFEGYLSHIFDTMGIKNISILYEYWVFFKIAKELFGSEATLAVIEQLYEKNNLKYGLRISKESYTLFYNKTYKHEPSGSYSFKLRPDISLEISRGGKTRRYFFDAKYSNTSLPSINDKPDIVYKNPNVVKMLSYLESIKDSYFALIVYPGTKFAFYSKPYLIDNNLISDPIVISDFVGVGALPLSPNHAESNKKFNCFLHRFKNHCL